MVMVSVAPTARLVMVQITPADTGPVGQVSALVMFKFVRLVGRSSIATLVAALVELVKFLTSIVYSIVWPGAKEPVVSRVLLTERSTEGSKIVCMLVGVVLLSQAIWLETETGVWDGLAAVTDAISNITVSSDSSSESVGTLNGTTNNEPGLTPS